MQDSKLPPAREPQSSPADEFKNWWKNFVWSADSTPEQLARLAWQASASQAAARIAELEKQIEMGKSVLRSCVDRDHYPKDSLYMLCMVASNAIHYRNQEMDRRQFEIKELLAERAALLEERDRLREAIEYALMRMPIGGEAYAKLYTAMCAAGKPSTIQDERDTDARETQLQNLAAELDKQTAAMLVDHSAPAIGAAASKSSGESAGSSATPPPSSSKETPK